MENLKKYAFTETITVDARTVCPGDVFLVAGWRAEVTAVDIVGDMIYIYYGVGGSHRQVGEFGTFVDGPFTLVHRKTVLKTKPTASAAASDADLEALREKLTGEPKHSCQRRDNLELVQAESERRRNLNISRAAEIAALEPLWRHVCFDSERNPCLSGIQPQTRMTQVTLPPAFV